MLKDVRVFLNTLSRSIDLMKQGGIDAGIQREETDDSLILTISIPKARQPLAERVKFSINRTNHRLRIFYKGGDFMISYFSELRYKEVIDVNSGFRLGYACDMEFDDAEGRIVSLVTPGRAKFFGLLGREDDYVLPWQSIVRIGDDIILVDCKGEVSRRKRRRRT